MILDAAIRVFARQGFHHCRVSDIADEAGVAYGLVYHYFKSKDQVLNELFTERWSLLLAATEEVDAQDIPARDKLAAVAAFIVDSYRHDPELMKVIIVEVTRAANSFGRTHLPEIRRAYDKIAKIVADGQKLGEFRSDVDPEFAAMWFYGAIEQLLSGWVFELIPTADGDFEHAKEMVVETICGGLEPRPQGRRRRGARRRRLNTPAPGGGRTRASVGGWGGRPWAPDLGPGPGVVSSVWESAATTRRQDRVLHGVAKIVNVIVGALIFPVWLVGQRLGGPFRRLLARAGHEPNTLPVPAPRERSMDALMGELEAIPHRLHPSETAELRKGLLDWAPFVLAQHRHTVGWGYSYPSQFRHDYFEGADGERIAAMVALHEQDRPGLIVVHGLFSNRLFDYVREIAVRAYFEWGFNVAAIDLRSFGLTELLSHAPSSAGWKEGEDIVFAGRHLKELGATTVGALGISFGSAATLNATHLPGAEEALDGGVLAICGPADTLRAAERLSRKVPPTHPAYAISSFFAAMLRSRVRAGRWPDEIDTLVEPIEALAAPYYGVTAEEIWERSSPGGTTSPAPASRCSCCIRRTT